MSPNLMVLCNQCFGFQFSSKIHSRKLLPLLNSSFFTELTVFNQMGLFSRNLKSSLEVKGAKRKFSDNLGHNILELCNVLVNIRLTTSKTQRDIQDSKLSIRVASGLAERPDSQDLMKKGIGKSQIAVETQPSAHFSFQKLNFSNSSPKRCKSRYQPFLVLSNFT